MHIKELEWDCPQWREINRERTRQTLLIHRASLFLHKIYKYNISTKYRSLSPWYYLHSFNLIPCLFSAIFLPPSEWHSDAGRSTRSIPLGRLPVCAVPSSLVASAMVVQCPVALIKTVMANRWMHKQFWWRTRLQLVCSLCLGHWRWLSKLMTTRQ